MAEAKVQYGGGMAEHYERHLGPAQFEPFAAFLAERLPERPGGDVLEIACGTGLVTRRLRERLDPAVRLVATDLSKAMLDYAQGKLPSCSCRTSRLRSLLEGAGFGEVRSRRRLHRFDGMRARDLATGQVRGTPRSVLIEKRGLRLDDVIDKLAARLAQTGGDPYRGHAAGFIVEARALG